MEKIINNDNLKVLKQIKACSIDLVYIDPPFYNGKQYEIIWDDKEEIEAYKVRNKGKKLVYNDDIEKRLKQIHRILKDTGSIYLHCDVKTSYQLKPIMDKIFGENNFRNEIIWAYNSGGASKNKFSNKHDIILLYSKSNNYVYNIQRIPYKAIIPKKNKHLFNSEGKMMDDVWNISMLSTQSKERLGYKTQKPEALLERIIKASSNPDDIILDCYMGGGTTLSVAKKLDRQYIGIDIAPSACKLTVDRINYKDIIYTSMIIEEDYRSMTPHKFQHWVCKKMDAHDTNPHPDRPSGADGGIDGYIHDNVPIYAECPIQVKHNLKSSFNADDISELLGKLMLSTWKYGFMIAVSFTPEAYERVLEIREKTDYCIKLITADNLNKVDKYKYD